MELDEKSFKELIHRQRDLIWRVCSGYRLRAAWTMEDAFHEVLCELWRGYGEYMCIPRGREHDELAGAEEKQQADAATP